MGVVNRNYLRSAEIDEFTLCKDIVSLPSENIFMKLVRSTKVHNIERDRKIIAENQQI